MSPIYARTTALAVLFILAVTVVPTGFRMPSVGSIVLGFNPWETAANLLLFFPLGLCLVASGIFQAACRGAMLSMAVEMTQFFMISRSPQPGDVVANTLGTLFGAAVAHWLALRFNWRFDRFRLGPSVASGAALVLMLFGAAFWYRASLWTWDSSYQLAVGDELTRDRRWDGEVFEIAIFDSSLDPGIIRTLADGGPGSIVANQRLFPHAPVFERTTPLNLENLRGRPLLGRKDAQRFFHSLVEAGKFTVLVWCRPARLNQFGPARILTYSLDIEQRNFTLGQEGGRVDFRVRTFVAGLNGSRVNARTARLLKENEDVLLAASYDGQVSRIFVNGRLAKETALTDEHLFWAIWNVGFLSGVSLLLGALLGITLLGLVTLPGRRVQWCIAGLAGGLAGAFVLATGGGEVHPFLGPFVALFAPVGALSLLWRSGPNLDHRTASLRSRGS